MGGTYKSTRATPKRLQVSKAATGTVPGPWTPDTHDNTYSWIDSQETISYRSSGRPGDEEIHPTNTREFITQMRENGEFKRPGYDIGHEFYSKKITRDGGFQDGKSHKIFVNSTPDRWKERSNLHSQNEYLHDGAWLRCEDDPVPGKFITTSDTVLGNRLMNMSAPNRPSANLLTTVSEIILGGLPALSALYALKDRASAIRGVGSEYLNVQFGWFPLVSDVTKIVQALLNAEAIIGNFAKGSGQFIRRRRSLPSLQRNILFEGANVRGGSAAFTTGYRPDGTQISSSGGGFSASVPSASLVVSVSARQDAWFSGAFTYYVPEAGQGFFQDLSRFEALANKLLGTRLTPEVLWEIAPWSWLVDWMIGIQSNISVATRFSNDGLVLNYGYLMVRDRVAVNSLFKIRLPNGIGFGTYDDVPAFTRLTIDVKRRIKSTPFGFGLNPSSFDARQWSILAALGMTKGPRTLR